MFKSILALSLVSIASVAAIDPTITERVFIPHGETAAVVCKDFKHVCEADAAKLFPRKLYPESFSLAHCFATGTNEVTLACTAVNSTALHADRRLITEVVVKALRLKVVPVINPGGPIKTSATIQLTTTSKTTGFHTSHRPSHTPHPHHHHDHHNHTTHATSHAIIPPHTLPHHTLPTHKPHKPTATSSATKAVSTA
jgi:hypothetical protein